jgi:hypothetical protein
MYIWPQGALSDDHYIAFEKPAAVGIQHFFATITITWMLGSDYVAKSPRQFAVVTDHLDIGLDTFLEYFVDIGSRRPTSRNNKQLTSF